jgi:tRNA 2-thiouridine synthesizing protein A
MDVPQPPADQPSAENPVQAPAQAIDITAEVCPMTFVRTKLKLERMRSGEILRVRLRGEEPLRNVPRAARDEGHAILAIEGDDDAHIVTIRRA